MLLRKILVNLDMGSISSVQQVQSLVDPRVIKSAAIVITMAPIVMVYPFFQKHFTKGVLIGAIKG
jgi:putative aldouronate transport system permease protein